MLCFREHELSLSLGFGDYLLGLLLGNFHQLSCLLPINFSLLFRGSNCKCVIDLDTLLDAGHLGVTTCTSETAICNMKLLTCWLRAAPHRARAQSFGGLSTLSNISFSSQQQFTT